MLRVVRVPALVVVSVVLMAAGGCRAADADAGVDTAALLTSGGDVAAVSTPALDHAVTSDDYRRWLAAEGALARIGEGDLAKRIPLSSASDAQIEAVAEALEARERVRAAIEGAGLSVRDYVETTIALEQAMAVRAPDAAARFRGVPGENVVIVDRFGSEIAQARAGSRIRVDDLSGMGDRAHDDGDDARAGAHERQRGKQRRGKHDAKHDTKRGSGKKRGHHKH